MSSGKKFGIMMLCLCICIGGFVAYSYYTKNVALHAEGEHEEHDHSKMSSQDWIYQDSCYVDNATGETITVEEFNSKAAAAGLKNFEIVEKPVMASDENILNYVEAGDGYELPGMPETHLTIDEYNDWMTTYKADLAQYEKDSQVYADNQKAMKEAFGTTYSYLDARYISKYDSDEWTPVTMYNEAYGEGATGTMAP